MYNVSMVQGPGQGFINVTASSAAGKQLVSCNFTNKVKFHFLALGSFF